MTDHPPDMVQAVEPSAEEVEAAARALCDYGIDPYDTSSWDGADPSIQDYYSRQAEAALKAAMAVRRGK